MIISGCEKRVEFPERSGTSDLGDDRQFANRGFTVEYPYHHQADCEQENRMVALNEKLHHPGTTALRRRLQVTGYGGHG